MPSDPSDTDKEIPMRRTLMLPDQSDSRIAQLEARLASAESRITALEASRVAQPFRSGGIYGAATCSTCGQPIISGVAHLCPLPPVTC